MLSAVIKRKPRPIYIIHGYAKCLTCCDALQRWFSLDAISWNFTNIYFLIYANIAEGKPVSQFCMQSLKSPELNIHISENFICNYLLYGNICILFFTIQFILATRGIQQAISLYDFLKYL